MSWYGTGTERLHIDPEQQFSLLRDIAEILRILIAPVLDSCSRRRPGSDALGPGRYRGVIGQHDAVAFAETRPGEAGDVGYGELVDEVLTADPGATPFMITRSGTWYARLPLLNWSAMTRSLTFSRLTSAR